jgi:hypothetical protein
VYAPTDLSKRWFVYYYYEEGKRIRITAGINKHKSGKRRMEAAEQIIVQLKEDHRPLKAGSATHEALRGYLVDGSGAWRESTYNEYRSIIEALCRFLGGKEINEEILRRFMTLQKSRLHPSSYNKYRDTIKRALSAIGCQNWFDDIPLLKAHQTPARFFQSHQPVAISRNRKTSYLAAKKTDPRRLLLLLSSVA